MANGMFSYSFRDRFSIPDDAEECDKNSIQRLIDKYMDTTYPQFEPEIVSVMSRNGNIKEYYLPALKALWLEEGVFYSPSRQNKWENMELVAQCKQDTRYTYVINPNNEGHESPHDSCECGIYGSVNLDELADWIEYDYERVKYGNSLSLYLKKEPKGKMILCIIEPSPNATVHLCRKGWKASKAFISEVVGDSISIDDASNLLSITWKREINVRRIYNANR